MLFEREGPEPNAVEDLFSRPGGVPLRINDYYPSIGLHRGLWLATIAISGAAVVTPEGEMAAWPPQQEHCTQAASLLAQLLCREWVHWMVVPAMGRRILPA